jgi:hypothetical protein
VRRPCWWQQQTLPRQQQTLPRQQRSSSPLRRNHGLPVSGVPSRLPSPGVWLRQKLPRGSVEAPSVSSRSSLRRACAPPRGLRAVAKLLDFIDLCGMGRAAPLSGDLCAAGLVSRRERCDTSSARWWPRPASRYLRCICGRYVGRAAPHSGESVRPQGASRYLRDR